MKKDEIKIGGLYVAKVNNKLATGRVDVITDYGGRASIRYYVTNLETGRKTSFRSAVKFRNEVKRGDGFKMPGIGRKLKLEEESPNPYIADHPMMPGDPLEGPPLAGVDSEDV